MTEQPPSSQQPLPFFRTPILSVLLLGAIGGGLWFAAVPLVSHRPERELPTRDVYGGGSQAPSRLWQDPFEAVENYRKGRKEGGTPRSLAAGIHDIAGVEPTVVLIVPVSGGAYAADAESRLRARRAVVAALGSEKFSPIDAEHLDIVVPPEGLAPRGNGEVLLPLEGFGATELNVGSVKRVAVIWLPNSLLARSPLDRLHQLVEGLRKPGSTEGKPLSFRFIGPRISGSLKQMLAECVQAGKTGGTPWAALSEVPFYSAWATADEVSLFADTSIGRGRRARVAQTLSDQGIEFHNFVHTDGELTGALARELANRGIRFGRGVNSASVEPRDSIVLISEYDTAYGRALPLSFIVEALHVGNPALDDAELYRAARQEWEKPESFFHFGYLRGTDGERPVGEADAQQASKGGEGGAGERLERAEGRGQLDYLRRLADKLRDHVRRGEIKRVKAVGVLGSDFYDKTLVLQALRSSFPGAIFFTTDLDARMMHPAHRRWTRNLLVASSRGLSPGDEATSGIAGFREAYQVTLFEAVKAALHDGATPDPFPPVRLFEVGRTRAVPLSLPPATDPNEVVVVDSSLQKTDIHRMPLTLYLIPIVALLFVWYLVPERVGRFAKRVRGLFPERVAGWMEEFRTTSVIVFFLFFGGALFLFPLYIVWISRQPGAEPFYLLEGVSVWPTELIRGTTFIVGSVLFLWARDALRENKIEINREFDLPVRLDTVRRVADWWARRRVSRGFWSGVVEYWRRISRGALAVRGLEPVGMAESGGPEGAGDSMEVFWEDYNAMGYSLNRVLRVAGAMVCFVLLVVVAGLTFGFPNIPYRGHWLVLSDRLPTFLAVITQVFLTFFVLDAALLCRAMVEGLTSSRIRWQPAKTKRFAERWGLAPDLVEDWMDVQLIGRRTKVIMPLIYHPFITLFLLIVARSTMFDAWDWPWALIIAISTISFFALCSVWTVRRSAEQARRRILERMKRKKLELMARAETGVVQRFQELIDDVARCRLGAFAPLSSQPVLRALMIPFGGAGLVTVLDLLTYW